MNKIFVEGVCGTGKSTIIKMLAEKLPALTIPEFPEFARGLLFPFNSEMNIQNNFLKYVEYECIREGVFSRCPSSIDYVIADRSYLSTIALALSMKDYLGNDFINEIISVVIEKIGNEDYQVPDKIVVLCADYNIAYCRNKNKRKNIEDIWLAENRIMPQIEFYDYLIKEQLAVSISTNGTLSESFDKCLNECQQHQHVLSKGDLIYGLRKYKFQCL